MFRKSDKNKQIDLFSSVPTILQGKSQDHYNDPQAWHNQFRKQIVHRIDESVFQVLYSERMGAPNASISELVGMMILKEAFGWSDAQLFEQCRFNLLVRSALGLVNLHDEVPSESTYYLFRKRLYLHKQQHNEDLFEQTFELITGSQAREFNVSGQSIRMDSKLIGSNIALYSRYEIIHQSLVRFCKTLNNKDFLSLTLADRQELKEILQEESQKTVYRSNKEEIQTRLKNIGGLLYRIINLFSALSSDEYQLFKRVFSEHYRVLSNQSVELLPKTQISTGSVQSPHDPDSGYTNKANKHVRGYNMNITETNDDHSLNLITNIQTVKANVGDAGFVPSAIVASQEITGNRAEKVYADGAFHSPANEFATWGIDMVYTGMQGYKPKHDIEMTPQGLRVTDIQTGETQIATKARKNKNNKEDRYYIDTPLRRYYFGKTAINSAIRRRKLQQRSIEEIHKRNNVEATIFQVFYTAKNNKTKYRSQFKNHMYLTCRSLWVNLVRIIKFVKQTCQRTFQMILKGVYSSVLPQPHTMILTSTRVVMVDMGIFVKKITFLTLLFNICQILHL